MRLGLNQPYLFPYLGYFQLLHAVHVRRLRRRGFHQAGLDTPNHLLINGEASLFTVPVRDQSSFRPIREVLIDDRGSHRWRSKLLKTIDNAYRRAPEFDATFPLVEQVLNSGVSRIGELALRSIKAVAGFLDLTTTFVDSTTVYEPRVAGRTRFWTSARREAQRITSILPWAALVFCESVCRARRAAPLHRPQFPGHWYFGAEFVPGLSIIDVLMFNPRRRRPGISHPTQPGIGNRPLRGEESRCDPGKS